MVLSPLGEQVRERWMATEAIYPQIRVVGLQIMPDHLHGILFVREQMEVHLGAVIKGFKAGCNKVFREMEAEKAAATEGGYCRRKMATAGGRR